MTEYCAVIGPTLHGAVHKLQACHSPYHFPPCGMGSGHARLRLSVHLGHERLRLSVHLSITEKWLAKAFKDITIVQSVLLCYEQVQQTAQE